MHRVASAPTSVRRTRSIGTTVGSKNSFWAFTGAIGSNGSAYAQRPATLKAVTAHGYIWIDDTLISVADADVTAIANDFENAYASDTTHFGTTSYTTSSPGGSTCAARTPTSSAKAATRSTVPRRCPS